MKIHTRVTLVLTTILLLLNTANAQGILTPKPAPSRAEKAPLSFANGQDYSTSDTTKVVVIGSGTPAADPLHQGISVAVVVNGEPYIIDCGPGVLAKLAGEHPGVRREDRCSRTEEIDSPLPHSFAL